MKPGEIRTEEGFIEINQGRKVKTIRVSNTGDRPIQVGSHYHFFEANRFLSFPRDEAFGMRLNVASGTAVRFEPGEEKEVELVECGGNKRFFGLNALTEGDLDKSKEAVQKAKEKGFKGV
ncbi:urease subunit beta [Thalassorhabdus alkalitolerans]|uniref:Urease subunit beta n=1 Tax=Thalassorhabdus alkalitolerans TaxID=2282697 RepID=A0ABW0YN75_9BACI|nr:urease subunit beta [Bacillus sp. FJAT-44742]